MKNNIIAITGMTGVGKDFLLNKAAKPSAVQMANLGTIISEELGTNRDTMMSEVDSERIRQAQLKAYRRVVETQPIIVTCHTVRPYKRTYSYDLEMERIFSPKLYIFIWAPPHIIAKRVHQRNETGVRRSPEMSVDVIASEQEVKLERVRALTTILGCELLVFNNIDANLDGNIVKLNTLFQQLCQ